MEKQGNYRVNLTSMNCNSLGAYYSQLKKQERALDKKSQAIRSTHGENASVAITAPDIVFTGEWRDSKTSSKADSIDLTLSFKDGAAGYLDIIKERIRERREDFKMIESKLGKGIGAIRVEKLRSNVSGDYDPKTRKTRIDSDLLAHSPVYSLSHNITTSIYDVLAHEIGHDQHHTASANDELVIANDANHELEEGMNSLYTELEYGGVTSDAYWGYRNNIIALLSERGMSQRKFQYLYGKKGQQALGIELGLDMTKKVA